MPHSTLIDELRLALGVSAVVASHEIQRPVSYWNSAPAVATALVRPATTAQVSTMLRICHAHGQSVVTQGGMTNCVAAADSQKQEVILSTERLNHIEEIDPIQGTATVGAGVVLQSLQEACEEYDMLFPLDLGARGSCTIGGNVATNAGGVNVLRYGMTRSLVLGMEVVLADGTILTSMNHMLKNNTAYDLKQLFIGSEGTLGVVTRVILRIFPRPTSIDTALIGLESFEMVINLLQVAQSQLGGTLNALEVMWGDHYRGVTRPGAHVAPMNQKFPYYILLESQGSDPTADSVRFNALLESCHESGTIADAVVAQSDRERKALWEIRENFEPILQPDPCFLYDVSLPIVAMDNYVNRVVDGINERWRGSEVYVLGHIVDGNIHFFIRPAAVEDDNLHQEVDEIVYSELVPDGGSISAEHGIGIEKLAWLGQNRSDAELAVMRSIKQTLDPANILNPGRVLPMA